MTKTKGARTHTSKALQRVLGKVSPEEMRRTEQRMLLATKIADAIEASGMSKTQVADKLGKHPSEITKWLSGTHNFTSDTLFDIQDALGIVLIELEHRAVITEIFNATFDIVIPMMTPPVFFMLDANKRNFFPEWGLGEKSVCVLEPQRLVTHGG